MAATATQHSGQAQEQPQPLRVIIIGAGIAGLTLAIVLRQNGHHAELYEQSRFARELGAAVHMAPNAHGLFRRLGIDLTSTGANEVESINEYAFSGTLNREVPIKNANKIWQHPWMLAHRVRIHEALKEKALETGGVGQPCKLHLSSPVVSVDPQNATITLENGVQVSGDVVVGADGVHSKSRQKITGGENAKPFGSGKSGFRFMIKREDALNDTITRKLCEKPGVFNAVVGSDRRIIMYPTSNNTLLNFLCIHPDSESEAGEDWNSSTSKSALLKVYKDFAPEFQAILAKADPESLKLWKLLDMENLPTWVESRLALIGDAAHPFLPHQGQGAAMAMEDAVALGIVLEKGLSPNAVPERLKLYNEIRYERGCRIQQYTRLAGLDVQDNKLDTIEYSRYNFAHDEFDNSMQRLREWKWARLPRDAFRMPVVFGPDPRIVKSIGRDACSPSFRTLSITFKTSRTLIKNFFPFGRTEFLFSTPGTLQTCSFIHTTFENVRWLSGASYSVLGLYVHDVTYQGTGEPLTRGLYVPVMFENDQYIVSSDRETHALPAVFSEIISEQNGDHYQVTARSNGLDWANLSVEDLRPTNGQTSFILPDGAADLGLLSWRCVPKFGDGRTSEVEAFAVKIPFVKDDTSIQIQHTYESSKASIDLKLPDTTKLGTCAPIVERLCEIPNYGILTAKLIVGSGTPAFGLASRI